MDVFDYIEKELDRIEVGYTSHDGTRLIMTIDDVRELVENLRIKLAWNLPNACTDPIEREDVVNILHDAMQGCSESEENLIGEIVSKVDLLPSALPESCGDVISREYLKEHIEACWENGRPRHAPELNELLSWVDDVPSAQPDVPDINVGDLISRAAAIEAQEKIMADHPLDGYEDELLLIKALNDLPSIQPDQQTIADQKSDLIYRETARRIIDSPRSKSQMLTVFKCTPPVQSEITLESAIDYLHSIGWMQNHDRILSEAAQPDAVTASLEELINDYGEDGYFIVDGVNYQANELLNELKINSSVGKKFRKQITKTIVAYFMKFGD